MKKWYVLTVLTGHERKAAREIAEQAEHRGFADKISDVYVPLEEVTTESDTGETKSRIRPVAPGYVLIKAEMEPDVWHMLRSMNDITGFAGGDKEIAVPLTEEEVHEWGLDSQEGAELKEGDCVYITCGALEGHNGTVISVNNDRAMLNVFAMGRPITVEMNVKDLEIEEN